MLSLQLLRTLRWCDGLGELSVPSSGVRNGLRLAYDQPRNLAVVPT